MGLYDKFARLANDREQFQTSGLNPFGTCIDEVYSATQGRIGDQKIVLAGTNNYLGLTFDAQAIAAALADISVVWNRLVKQEPMLTRSKIRELTHHDWSASNHALSQQINWFPQVSLERALREGLF